MRPPRLSLSAPLADQSRPSSSPMSLDTPPPAKAKPSHDRSANPLRAEAKPTQNCRQATFRATRRTTSERNRAFRTSGEACLARRKSEPSRVKPSEPVMPGRARGEATTERSKAAGVTGFARREQEREGAALAQGREGGRSTVRAPPAPRPRAQLAARAFRQRQHMPPRTMRIQRPKQEAGRKEAKPQATFRSGSAELSSPRIRSLDVTIPITRPRSSTTGKHEICRSISVAAASNTLASGPIVAG